MSNVLEDLYRQLKRPESGSLAALTLPERGGRFHVAKTVGLTPAVLVEIPAGSRATGRFGENLENLSYAPRQRVRIETPSGESHEGVFAVLACRSLDPELQHYFLRIAGTLVEELGVEPAPSTIDRCMAKVVELFRALEGPGRRSAQGIWGELLVIAHSADPRTAILAWYDDPAELHDFSSGVDGLEVKTTVGPARTHRFRLEQLNAPEQVIVLSLVLAHSEGGPSIADLADRILEQLPEDTDHSARLERLLATSLGSSWREMTTARFDEPGALRSLRAYEAASVPRVGRVPREVTAVRFSVDLSSTEPIDLQAARDRAALFEAVLPPQGAVSPRGEREDTEP